MTYFRQQAAGREVKTLIGNVELSTSGTVNSYDSRAFSVEKVGTGEYQIKLSEDVRDRGVYSIDSYSLELQASAANAFKLQGLGKSAENGTMNFATVSGSAATNPNFASVIHITMHIRASED